MTTRDASLFELLSETLPMSAALWAANYYAVKKDFIDLSVQDVHPYIGWIPANAKPFGIPTPALNKSPREDFHTQRLWTFDFDPSDPATVSSIWCRVNNAGFASHKVLERIEWGYEDMSSGIFEKAVLVTTSDGKDIKLPLTPEFVQTMYLINNGYLPEGENPLWPLEMFLDRGLVIALVYEVGLDHQVSAWKGPAAADRKANEEALKDVLMRTPFQKCAPSPGPPPPPSRPQEATPKPADPNLLLASTAPSYHFEPPDDVEHDLECNPSPWGVRMSQGKLMPRSKAQGAVSGQVPANESAAVAPMKIVVVLSLATCRERVDFEPGAMVGMARIYPHIMVRADADLLKIEATVRYDRPDKTERKDDGLDGEPMTCCKGYDAVDQEINAILVTDTNERWHFTPAPPPPFWSDMFDYYQPDAYKNLGQEKLKIICNDSRGQRTDETGLIERDAVLGGDMRLSLTKMPHQGEFDNIHMAPKLKLVNVTHVSYERALKLSPAPALPDGSGASSLPNSFLLQDLVPVDREALALDHISMAPFCAHDCFHMHWRWGAKATKRWNLGWSDTLPHQVAGAPLVPLNQEIYIWFRAAARISVHHLVGRSDGSVDWLPANEWQIVMYQGAAYAVQVEEMILWAAIQGAYGALAPPPKFYDVSSGVVPKLVSVAESTSLFYWYSRWQGRYEPVLKGWVIEERLRTDRIRLARARAF